jgi:extracellular matrix regulatory protein A
MEQTLLNIGFGSTVVAERVVAIVSPNSAPMKRLKDEAKEEKRLVDATHGRRTRSIIIMDSNHVILSAIQSETISNRYTTLRDPGPSDRLKKSDPGEQE